MPFTESGDYYYVDDVECSKDFFGGFYGKISLKDILEYYFKRDAFNSFDWWEKLNSDEGWLLKVLCR